MTDGFLSSVWQELSVDNALGAGPPAPVPVRYFHSSKSRLLHAGEEGEGRPEGRPRDVVFERLFHGHKHEFFAYLLKTCRPGTFRVHHLGAFVEEVAQVS